MKINKQKFIIWFMMYMFIYTVIDLTANAHRSVLYNVSFNVFLSALVASALALERKDEEG